MTEILEILKYILPSIIVFFTAFFLLRIYLNNEEKKKRLDLSMNRTDTILPVRLQAFERLILYLERISPDSLVMRFKNQKLSVAQLQNELIQNVRSEYEHNLSQQTYISSQAWKKIKMARSEIIKLINTSAAELNPADQGINLSKRILEKAMNDKNPPTQEALEFLKNEVRQLF
ncbi:MAG: hypothetical protein ACOCZL_00800 [Bacteroidota bacterium]